MTRSAFIAVCPPRGRARKRNTAAAFCWSAARNLRSRNRPSRAVVLRARASGPRGSLQSREEPTETGEATPSQVSRLRGLKASSTPRAFRMAAETGARPPSGVGVRAARSCRVRPGWVSHAHRYARGRGSGGVRNHMARAKSLTAPVSAAMPGVEGGVPVWRSPWRRPGAEASHARSIVVCAPTKMAENTAGE